MAILDVSKKSFEIALVFSGCLVLFSFEWSVFHVGAAVFAPVFGLR